MSRKFKYFLLIISIIFLCSCEVDEKSTNKNRVTNSETKEIEKPIYKICSKEYLEYIKNISDMITVESEVFTKVGIRTRDAYLIVTFYPSKRVEEKKFDDEIISIYEKTFNELIKNNYDSKCGLKLKYETLDLEFYNYEKNRVNPSYHGYKRFEILEVNNYNSFSEYIETQKNT